MRNQRSCSSNSKPMGSFQGGDWNTFFIEFDLHASRVDVRRFNRPPIVDDNVPLPITRAHHFDIAYQDAVDKYVTCQVCGMLLRRSIFASHLRIRHAEMFPESNSPQIDEDSTNQWLSEEYPEIIRNSSSTTSPNVTFPSLFKEPVKIKINLRDHSKKNRKKVGEINTGIELKDEQAGTSNQYYTSRNYLYSEQREEDIEERNIKIIDNWRIKDEIDCETIHDRLKFNHTREEDVFKEEVIQEDCMFRADELRSSRSNDASDYFPKTPSHLILRYSTVELKKRENHRKGKKKKRRRVKDHNNAYEPPNKRIQNFHLVLNQNSQRRACIIGSSPCKGSKEMNLKQAECKVSSNCLSTMKYSGNYLSSTQSGSRSITDQPLDLPIFPLCNQKIMLDIQKFHIPLSVPPFYPLTKSLTSAMCSSSILELKHFTSSNNSFVFPALQNSQEVSSSNQMRYLDIKNSQSTVLSPFHYQSYSKNTGLFNSKLQILSKDACKLKTSEMLAVESSICSRAKQTVERSIPDEPISSCVNLDFFKTDYNTPLLDNRNFPVISSLATSQQQELTDLQVRYESTSFDPRNIGTTQLHKNFNGLIISPGSHKLTQWNQDTIINSVSNLSNVDREKDGRETVAYLLSTPETLSSEGIPCYSITPEDATLKEEQKEKSSSHPVSVSCLQMKSHNLDAWQFFLPKGTNGEKTHEMDRFLKKLRVERLLSGLSNESIDAACERILEENKHWIIEKKNDEEMTRIVLPIEYDKIELPILRLTGKENKVSNETSLASSNIKNKLEAFRAGTETVNVGWDEIKSLENLLIGERKYEKGLEPDILVIGETNRLKSELFKNGESRINLENITSIDQRRSYHLDPLLDETYTLNKDFKLENNSLSNNHKGKVSASKPKELFTTRMLMNMIRSNRIELEITQESEEENREEQHEDQQTNMNRRDEDTGDLMDCIRNWTVEPLRRKTRPAVFSSLQGHVGNLLSSNWHKYDEIKKDCHTERTNYNKKILCNNKSENGIASMPILAHNSLQLSLEQVNKISPKYIADFQKTLDVFEEQSVESITCSFSFERIPVEESASISYSKYLKGNKGCQTSNASELSSYTSCISKEIISSVRLSVFSCITTSPMTIASKNEGNLVVEADKIVSTPQSTMSLSRITNAMAPVRRRLTTEQIKYFRSNLYPEGFPRERVKFDDLTTENKIIVASNARKETHFGKERHLIKSVEDSSQNSKDALKSGNKDNRGKFGSIFEKYQEDGSKRHPLESAVVSRELEKLLREVEQVPGGLEKILRDRGKIPPGLVQVVGTLRQMAKAGKCAGQGSSSNPDPSILKINNEPCLSKMDLVRKEITTAKFVELILQEQSRVPPIKKTRSSQQPSVKYVQDGNNIVVINLEPRLSLSPELRNITREAEEIQTMVSCGHFLKELDNRKRKNKSKHLSRNVPLSVCLFQQQYLNHIDEYLLIFSKIRKTPFYRLHTSYQGSAYDICKKILQSNREQMNYNPPALCPWKDLCRRWNEYGYLMTPATADGSEDGLEVEGLIKDAINAQWRKDYGIKVKDADRRGLLRDVHNRLKRKIEEYQKNIKDDGVQLNYKTKGNHRFKNKYSTVPDQKNANNDLTRRCQLLDKNSENRKRLYTLRFLHNAFPGCIVDKNDVVECANQRNETVAGLIGPEKDTRISDMIFSSLEDQRPAWLDIDDFLELILNPLIVCYENDFTIGTRRRKLSMACADGTHITARLGSDGLCHIDVAPFPFSMPQIKVDSYGILSTTEAIPIDYERYPHLAVRLSGNDPYQLNRKDLLLDDFCIPFNDECIIGSDYADLDWTLDGFNILPLKFKDPPSAIDVKCTTYGEPQNKSIMSEEEMCDLLLQM